MDFFDRRADNGIDHREFVIPGGSNNHLHRLRSGCDLVSLAEVEESIATFGERYLETVFSAAEVLDCSGIQSISRLAARFAAKEAVIKAFAEPSASFPLTEIEVTKAGELPGLRLSGSLARLADQQGWESVSLSLSHTDCHALAAVFVLCGPQTIR